MAVGKNEKVREANNKANDHHGDVEGDVYDELLTQDEIQDHIDKINLLLALERVGRCVKLHDLHGLQLALSSSRHLKLEAPVKISYMQDYCMQLERKLEGGTRGINDGLNFLRREDVEAAVLEVNAKSNTAGLKETAVKRVNSALGSRDVEALIMALQVIERAIQYTFKGIIKYIIFIFRILCLALVNIFCHLLAPCIMWN